MISLLFISRYRAEGYLVPWYIVGLLISVYNYITMSKHIGGSAFSAFWIPSFWGWQERIMISRFVLIISIVYAKCIYLHSTYCRILNIYHVNFPVVRIMEDPLGYEIIHAQDLNFTQSWTSESVILSIQK